MDVLKEITKMIKQKGFATIAAIALMTGAFLVGMICEHYIEQPDHPIEQAAESVLKAGGVEHDFSASKKEQSRNDARK